MRDSQVAVFVHLVWATWDRLPLLTEEVARGVYRAIAAKCRELKAEVVAIGGVEDHIHVLVQLSAPLSVADLAKHVKGASSHLANYRLPGGGSFRWQGSYAAFSVDPRRLDRLIAYIANQHDHHHAGTIYGPWEQAPAPDNPGEHPRAAP